MWTQLNDKNNGLTPKGMLTKRLQEDRQGLDKLKVHNPEKEMIYEKNAKGQLTGNVCREEQKLAQYIQKHMHEILAAPYAGGAKIQTETVPGSKPAHWSQLDTRGGGNIQSETVPGSKPARRLSSTPAPDVRGLESPIKTRTRSYTMNLAESTKPVEKDESPGRRARATTAGDSHSNSIKHVEEPRPTIILGAHTTQGSKPSDPGHVNQDRYLSVTLEEGPVLVGVFDGHGPAGHFISQRAKDVFAGMARGIALAADISAAFKQAFAQCLKEIEKEMGSEGSGTTATLAVIDADAQTVSLAHVGDSKAAVLNSSGGLVFETRDHKADAEGEGSRIRSQGGLIYNGRLCLHHSPQTTLALSRALGDTCYKQYGLSAEPEVVCGLPFAPGGIVILASDGLWDMVPMQEAAFSVTVARPQEAAQFLVNTAVPRWSNQAHMDDITVVVAKSAPKDDSALTMSFTSSTIASGSPLSSSILGGSPTKYSEYSQSPTTSRGLSATYADFAILPTTYAPTTYATLPDSKPLSWQNAQALQGRYMSPTSPQFSRESPCMPTSGRQFPMNVTMKS
jgi:serine/threonine protein phosphatase PrpC